MSLLPFGPLPQPSAVAEVKVYVFVPVCTSWQVLRCKISSDGVLFWEGEALEDGVVYHLPPYPKGPSLQKRGLGPASLAAAELPAFFFFFLLDLEAD